MSERAKAAETWILTLDLKRYYVSSPYKHGEVPPEEAHLPRIILSKRGRRYAAEFRGRIPRVIREIAEDVWLAYKDPEWVERFVVAILRRMEEKTYLRELRGEGRKRFTLRELEESAATNPLEEYFEPEPPAPPEPDLDIEYVEGGDA